MPLCCLDVSVGARVVAVAGLIVAAVVVTQLSAELARGAGDGGVAALLGLSLDELDSRQRQVPHAEHHDRTGIHGHGLPWPPTGDAAAEPFDSYVRGVFSGFLAFAVLYGAASALLAYTSVVHSRYGALPWLLLHALSIASQVARVVVQIAQYEHMASDPDRVADLAYHHPVLAHPYHEGDGLEQAWEEHVREHRHEHGVEAQHAAVMRVCVATVYLLVSAYAWLVVLVAHRDWLGKHYGRRSLFGPGDEGFSLSIMNLASKEILTSKPRHTQA